MKRQRTSRNHATTMVALFICLLVVLLPITHAASISLTYDTNGNLVTGDGKYRTYNDQNQIVRLYNGSNASGTLLQEYSYHPSEERILWKKTYNATGSLIETVVYVNEEFVQITNISGTYNYTYLHANGQQIAQVLPDNSKQFLLGDMEGSTRATTNNSGAVVERTSYTPFGGVLDGGSASRFNYEARENDPTAGDTDFRFRKYKPDWGIFTQPDSVIPTVYDPQNLNRYSFERNNPHRYTDPTGHIGEEEGGLVVGFGLLFAPEITVPILIGAGIGIIGGLIWGYVKTNEAAPGHIEAKGRGLTGKEYPSKENMWDAELPRGGEAPFVDPKPKDRGGRRYKIDKEGRPVDADGNPWQPDYRERHWDKQLPDGSHQRITPEGKLLGAAAVVIPSATSSKSGSTSNSGSKSTLTPPAPGSSYVSRGITITVAKSGVTNGVVWSVSTAHAPTYKIKW